MTTAEELVASVRAGGVDLMVSGGRIRVEGPRGALTPEYRAALADRREEVLAVLVAEADAAALDRLDAVLGDDGAEPDDGPPAGGSGYEDETYLDRYVANALALSPEDRAAWRREVVHGMVWAEAGRGQDPGLASSVRALRRVVPPGRCLRCDAPCPADGRHWCDRCASEYPKVTEVQL